MDDIVRLLEKLKLNPSEGFESEFLEFKNYSSEQSLHNAKELAEEISAIANNKGGRIIIGIVDSSNIQHKEWHNQLQGFVRVDIDTTKERILGKLEPKIDISLRELEYEKKIYLIINIPNVMHSLVSTSSGKTYIRTGKSSIPARPDQIQTMVKSLQSYDWSNEDLATDIKSSLNKVSLSEAKKDFCERRKIPISHLSDYSFLESIGATRNGVLNKGGLLFLGNAAEINKFLGIYEYRFSWKTGSGELKVNDIWSDNVWNTIVRAKVHFKACNSLMHFPYEGMIYELYTLDHQAFHEAYLNAIVHRDYSKEGMTSVNFIEKKLIITNPGSFYGGVNSSNITFHEPRHRNKTLAKILMNFQLVDRAGMGVLRMGLNSLKYGREFPIFKEKHDNIEVLMIAERFIATIFLLTQKYLKDCNLTELYILNSLYKIGSVSVTSLENKLSSLVKSPWEEIHDAMAKPAFAEYFTYKANNDGVYICVSDVYSGFFDVSKQFKGSSNSEKHVKLFLFLKEHNSGSNEELMNLLDFSSSASTYQFLSKLKYVINKGKSRKSKWYLNY